ncbi:MAG: hypothetical protein KDC88_07150 [Ignavibacteriae bacterium]|nr:hypothetical protein [Ignavibacteriota bacterium]
MFKNEIKFITDLNLNKLQILGKRFTIEDIKKSRIHPALLQFINANIDSEIFKDRKRIEKNSILNYQNDRINNYFKLIGEEIKLTQNFDLSYIKQSLQNAVIFNVNFLTQPNKTLTNFIFGDSNIKSVEEIIIGISHAYYYKYLQKIIFTYLDKKQVLSMSKIEFSTLLNRVDELSKETHLEETLNTAVNSMANFFDLNSKIPEKLPIEAVKLYLEEKQLKEFKSNLENKFDLDSNSLFTTTEILNELKSVTPETEIAIEEAVNSEDQFEVDIEEKIDSDLDFDDDPEVELKSEIASQEIFEVSNDDEEIPNHEILSESEIVEENNIIELTETIESNDIEFIEDDIEENEQIVEEDKEENNNDKNKDELNDDQNYDSVKKKPETKFLLKELVNINSVYEALLPPVIPFQDFQTNINELSQIISNSAELNYQIDISTLSEEINIRKHVDIKEINEEEKIDNEIIGEEKQRISEIKNEFEVFEPYEEVSEISNNKNEFDINDTIDEVVSNENNEIEFIEEVASKEIMDVDLDEKQDLENLINESELKLTNDEDSEITEVFTDLSYLDEEENFNEPAIIENDEVGIFDEEETEEKDELDNSEIENETYSNFTEMIANKDMTKIIGAIFDYDMEDYNSVIEKISMSQNETEAIQYTEEYCLANHIELSSNEVEIFKSLITEYFTQTYS